MDRLARAEGGATPQRKLRGREYPALAINTSVPFPLTPPKACASER